MQSFIAAVATFLIGGLPSFAHASNSAPVITTYHTVATAAPGRTERVSRSTTSVSAPVTNAPVVKKIVPKQAPVSESVTTPAPTAPTVAQPAQINAVSFVSEVESLVLQGINAQRAANGLSPLSSDSKLAAIARAHGADMLAKNYFNHTNLAGCDPACRLNNAGYGWSAYAENIAWMTGYNLSAADTAKKFVTDWMNSAGHRANILNGTYTVIGVGIASSGSTVYATTDLALPR